MLKMVVESWARTGLTREKFISYLANTHGPLVHKHADALGFRKYLQNHRITAPEIDLFAAGRGWPSAPDSSVELWLEDMETISRAMAGKEGMAASSILEEDERRFVDPSRVSAFLSREKVIFDYTGSASRSDDPAEMVKMVCQIWKRPGMSDQAFRDRWRIQHGDLVRTHAQAMGFLRYVQSHRVPSKDLAEFAAARGWREAPDGLTEVWWSSQAAMKEAFASAEASEASRILANDEIVFIDPTRVTAFLAREHIVFDNSNR
jgi:hypothetical protein